MEPIEAADNLVYTAAEMAKRMHDDCGHKRSNGEPYWRHPERVAAIVESHGLSVEVQAAAWLHDVAEDCAEDQAGSERLLSEIGTRFGTRVSALVREVTNFATPDETMETKQARLIRHAGSMSEAAKWIKLVDRLDNISGMDGWSPSKKNRYATATAALLGAIEPIPHGAAEIVERIRRCAAQQLKL